MKIIFPEFNHPTIQAAIKACPELTAIPAESLTSGCQMLTNNEGDGIITGIDYTTRDVILACREHIPIKNQYFSSSFIMQKDDQILIIADGGVCKSPTHTMLTAVVEQTYETACKILDETPKIAMLSFSTYGSGGKDPSIDKIHQTIKDIKSAHPEILIDGEMQLDVALDKTIGDKKAANSPVAGSANVLICPDLNSGNILYKALERLGGWTAAGPILQGFTKPISDLSRGSTVEDVILVIKTLEKLSHD